MLKNSTPQTFGMIRLSLQDQTIDIKRERTENNTLNITHEQLANKLGPARTIVSRLLKQLEENGIVLLGRNKITILK